MGKLSNKVTAIAAGEAHTLALTGEGLVYSWGRGTFGRLGTGREEDELFPVPIEFGDERPKFVGIAAGAYHSLALQDDGSIWSWGYNICILFSTYFSLCSLILTLNLSKKIFFLIKFTSYYLDHSMDGQLGHGEENSSIPALVEPFQELGTPDSLSDRLDENRGRTPLKVCSISAGGMMSLAIDSQGALWTWGNCPQASKTDDSKFCLAISPSPLPVWEFHGHTVVKVACGSEHVVAAVSTGEMYTGGDLVCYSWGNNSRGQLGLGDKENRPKPHVIPTFNQDSTWSVYEISCGAFHTAILAHSKSYDQEINYKCWTFGLGDNGQLGHGTTISTSLPVLVNGLPPDAILISVDCGLFHTSVVSVAGEVWSWGMERGLGLCPDASFGGNDAGDALLPLRIRQKFDGPIQVACGAAHTVLVADNGYKMWAWGRGRSGVLGRGNTMDSIVPCIAVWPPLDEDFKEKGRGRKDEVKVETHEGDEMRSLKEKLAIMERYATVLHISIFQKPLDERCLTKSLDSGVFDIMKEMENVMESADTEELARLEMFYRSMLSRIKDKLMRRRVQEMVKDCIVSLSRSRAAGY